MEKDQKMFCQEGLGKFRIRNYEDWQRYDEGNQSITQIDDRSVQAQYLIRNTSRNASIDKFALEIQSAAGNYTFDSGEDYPYKKSKSELYRDVSKHCLESYPELGIWDKHECAVILHVSDFARSLSSDGCSFPCTFSAKVRFTNKAQAFFGQGASGLCGGNGIYPLMDAISGTPLMIGIFPRQSLTVAPSSSVLGSQNISHSSAMEILSRR